MKKILKALTGTAAAFAMAVTPSYAFANVDDDRGGIGAGEIIAGAVVIGGIAALAGAFDRNDRANNFHRNNWRGDWRRGNRGFNNGFIGPRRAVNRCVRAAERRASRIYGPANVTQIRDVDRTRFGYRIRGRIVVEDRFRGFRNIDRGRFTCRVDNGRISGIQLRRLGNGR
ncbi:hypothetical protein [Alterisphingorhabdus coralli]|uniref:Uncharacterized protein n=1 Tax=Alterisphingorhabdus coralli TaxID=3071408 RepID=A0AA97I1N6_9SPHN|nr:hypothetical protein [Parasphingorhabdus sp. SCSIO 66989]WOE76247.1 hypothetical protein RB602_05915 [Parasphingorhabdus sp. SCSIO 66989]